MLPDVAASFQLWKCQSEAGAVIRFSLPWIKSVSAPRVLFPLLNILAALVYRSTCSYSDSASVLKK